MNRIGNIILPDLTIENEFMIVRVRAVVKMALAGNAIVWEDYAHTIGYDLTGTENAAWITRNTLLALKELLIPNATYEWEYEGVIKEIRFRHEDGAIEATPVRALYDIEDSDEYCNVIIRIMEI